VPTARTCLVSVTDTEGIRHTVEITAGSLDEAAAIAHSGAARHGECARPRDLLERCGRIAQHDA
jgi:hypothetical protein